MRDILARPSDDVPRLILADWLDEHGEPERAEFIRAQCGCARLGDMLRRPFDASHCTEVSASWCPSCGDCCCASPEDGMDDPACPLHSPISRHLTDDSVRLVIAELTRRANNLLFRNWPRWLHDAFDALAFDVGVSARDDNDFGVSLYNDRKDEIGHFDCSFRRGFVAGVRCELQFWLDRGASVLRAQPIEDVRPIDRRPRRSAPLGDVAVAWYDNGCRNRVLNIDDPEDLPTPLWKRLKQPPRRADGAWKVYDTEELAYRDISQALLEHAREGR